jgi:hypothetical protein
LTRIRCSPPPPPPHRDPLLALGAVHPLLELLLLDGGLEKGWGFGCRLSVKCCSAARPRCNAIRLRLAGPESADTCQSSSGPHLSLRAADVAYKHAVPVGEVCAVAHVAERRRHASYDGSSTSSGGGAQTLRPPLFSGPCFESCAGSECRSSGAICTYLASFPTGWIGIYDTTDRIWQSVASRSMGLTSSPEVLYIK